jgi:hypothetical protein
MRVTALALRLGLLLSSAVRGADRETISVTWTEFQRRMESRELPVSVRVLLTDGTAINTQISRVESDGIVSNQGGVAKILRAKIGRIQMAGREGKRGLTGALIGLGVGAGITAGTWAYYRGYDRESGFYNTAAAAISMPVGALAGYLIGRLSSRRAPEFVIVGTPTQSN